MNARTHEFAQTLRSFLVELRLQRQPAEAGTSFVQNDDAAVGEVRRIVSKNLADFARQGRRERVADAQEQDAGA